MRQSREHKDQTHRHILSTASRMLRQGGVAATGLGPVMKAAGLTHGGFYRHFASKAALDAAAIRAAFDEFLGPIENEVEPSARAERIEKFLTLYLSDLHIANPGQGCPVAALGQEVSRMTGPSLQAFQDGVARAVGLLDGRHADHAPHGYSGPFALAILAGAVSLARVADAQTAARVIADTRVALRITPPPDA